MTDQMPRAIARLQLDHRNMMRLLSLLRRSFEDYRAGGALDSDLLGLIVEYGLNYPDLCHHPLENRIYRRMAERDPVAANRIGNLLREHAHLGELTRKLAAALGNLARDSEIPRAWLEEVVEAYLTENERHMAAEERQFFPKAVASLSPEDWDAIDREAPAGEDPLFGKKLEQGYRALYERIVRG